MTPQFIDLSDRRDWRVVIDAEDGVYLGQPDTVLLDDETTILVAHPLGHGGPDTILRRSIDGGRTWSERMPVPDSFTGKLGFFNAALMKDRDGVLESGGRTRSTPTQSTSPPASRSWKRKILFAPILRRPRAMPQLA